MIVLLGWLLCGIDPAVAAAGAWLDADERAWLAAHPVVRIGVDPTYAPYAYLDAQGRYQGVSSEVMARLAADLGLRFELVPLPSWAEVLEAAKDRRIDLITTAVRLPARQEFLAFSQIYL